MLDGDGRPVRGTLVEIWQANAAGRYRHVVDGHPAPLDPNFTGAGRCLTDDEGRYRFITIKPGAYPGRTTRTPGAPSTCTSPSSGPRSPPAWSRRCTSRATRSSSRTRSSSVRDPKHRDRMISAFDLDNTVEEWALAYRFDIVLRGREATPMED